MGKEFNFVSISDSDVCELLPMHGCLEEVFDLLSGLPESEWYCRGK